MSDAVRRRRRGAVLFAAAAALLLPAAAQQPQPPSPSAASVSTVWDLTPLYATDAAWDADRQAAIADIPQLVAFKGRLGDSAATLRAALDTRSAQWRRMRRLWVYASTQQSTDNRDPRNQERMGLMRALAGQAGAASAWIDPELQALGTARVEAAIAAEPGLAPHAVALRRTLRLATHTLSAETEAALAALSPVTSTPSAARTLLVDADIPWPQITVDGQRVTVNADGYTRLRQHPDRAVRKQAFDAFFGTHGRYASSLGELLAGRIRAGTVQATLRRYPGAAAASLAADDIPESVVRMLVAQANAGLPLLHRSFRLRQRMLGLPDLQYHDIYPPLVASSTRYPADAAAQLTLEATRPLGPQYTQLLADALARRTVHLLPAEGKSSGAYQAGVWGLTPYVFLNHRDDFASLSTFAHEWGHGMHTLLADRAQPFETAGYSLFVAEVASTANEVLLAAHMQARANTRNEQLFMLGQELESLRGTFFRQTMFAEFELQVHDAVERGEALNGSKLTTLYCGLLRKYHGEDSGVMRIDPAVCSEWAYIPHFHRPFYVYQYATSYTAATAFVEAIVAGTDGARERYLGVLRAGGSEPPYALLRAAGVDLATPAPYQALLRRMASVLDRMEQLLSEPPG